MFHIKTHIIIQYTQKKLKTCQKYYNIM